MKELFSCTIGYVKVNWQQLSEDCAAAAGKTKDSLTKQGKVISLWCQL